MRCAARRRRRRRRLLQGARPRVLQGRSAESAVMDRRSRRSSGVSEAVMDPIAVVAPEERFESLYRRTFPRVYAYVASLLNDRSAAEEVTAQAFERAFRRRSS